MVRAALRAVKYAIVSFLVVGIAWLTFYFVFVHPRPGRVKDPLAQLGGETFGSVERPMEIYKDLLFALDDAVIDVPHLGEGRALLAAYDFFADYPYAKLEKAKDLAVSMTQGKYGMFLEQRNAIYLPTPAAVSFDVTVPENAELRFGASMLSRLNGAELAPVRITLDVDGNGDSRTLVDAALKPEPLFPYRLDEFWYKTILKHIRLDHGFKNGRWYDYKVDLRKYAGRHVTLRFKAESADGSLSHAFVSSPLILAPAHDDKPNVVIAILDTIRADFVGANNPGARGLTPNIDQLAEQGMSFTNVRSQGNWSRGSFASIFTGLPSASLGLADRWGFQREEKAVYNRRGLPSLPDRFREAGYATVSMGNNPFVYDSGPVGLHLGFGQSVDIQREPMDTEFATTEAIRWLKEHRGERFFMMFTINAAHSPFKPPVRHFLKTFRLGAGLQETLYRGVVAYADEYFGVFMTALDRLGLAGNTIVVATADHGAILHRDVMLKDKADGKFERIIGTHTHTLYEEELRVPLVIRRLGDIPPGGKSGASLALLDLAPSLTQLAGVAPDPRWKGVSFAGLARGAPDRDADERRNRRIIPAEGERVWSIVTPGNYKYIRRGRRMNRVIVGPAKSIRPIDEQVFDLARDPDETNDLSRKNVELLERLRARFEREYPPHIEIHKIVARGVDDYKNLVIDISTTGRFVFLETVPAEGNKNLEVSTSEKEDHRRTVTMKNIGSYVRIFFEVAPPGAPVTVSVKDGEANSLPEGALRIGPFALKLASNPVTLAAGEFYLSDPDRLVDERALRDGVYIATIPFEKWRADAVNGFKLDPELETLMKKWGYM